MQFALLLTLLFTAEGGWFSGRRRRRVVCEKVPEAVEEDVSQCNPVSKTRQVWKEVTKFRNQSKTVLKYDNATRLVNQTRSISYTLPVDDFKALALEEITEEILNSILNGTPVPLRRPTTVQSGVDNSSEAVVMYGRTQVAKSTTACQLRISKEDACPSVGDGSGHSVTNVSEVRSSKVGLLLDTPGIDDTQLRFTKEEAGKLVALGVAAAGVRRVKFAVFECMGNTAMHLLDTLASLQASFGASALSSAIVVASMANKLTGDQLTKRLASIKNVAWHSGIREVVMWRGPELFEEDLTTLQSALNRVEAVPITELEDLWQRQAQRAAELHAQQVPRTKEVVVEVEQDYIIERPETIWEEIPYTVQELFPEEYDTTECKIVKQTKTVLADRCREL